MSPTPPVSPAERRTLVAFRLQLRMFLSFSEQAAEAHSITAQQYQLLQIVGLAEEGEPTISLIAQRMLLRHNSAVELIDRAERASLVRRVPDPHDQRRALIAITPLGQSTLDTLLRQHLDYLYRSGPAMAQALALVLELEGGR